MSNVLRRLTKLEAQISDRSAYAPHSEEWFQYWLERCDRFLTDGDAAAIRGMPLAFLDDVIAQVPDGKTVENDIEAETTV